MSSINVKYDKFASRTVFIKQLVEGATKLFENSTPKPTREVRRAFPKVVVNYTKLIVTPETWAEVKDLPEARNELAKIIAIRTREFAGELFEDEANEAIERALGEIDAAILRADPATDEPGRQRFIRELAGAIVARYASEHVGEDPQAIQDYQDRAELYVPAFVNICGWLNIYKDDERARKEAETFCYCVIIEEMTGKTIIDVDSEIPYLVEKLEARYD